MASNNPLSLSQPVKIDHQIHLYHEFILIHIFSFLDDENLLNVKYVNRYFAKIARLLWIKEQRHILHFCQQNHLEPYLNEIQNQIVNKQAKQLSISHFNRKKLKNLTILNSLLENQPLLVRDFYLSIAVGFENKIITYLKKLDQKISSLDEETIKSLLLKGYNGLEISKRISTPYHLALAFEQLSIFDILWAEKNFFNKSNLLLSNSQSQILIKYACKFNLIQIIEHYYYQSPDKFIKLIINIDSDYVNSNFCFYALKYQHTEIINFFEDNIKKFDLNTQKRYRLIELIILISIPKEKRRVTLETQLEKYSNFYWNIPLKLIDHDCQIDALDQVLAYCSLKDHLIYEDNLEDFEEVLIEAAQLQKWEWLRAYFTSIQKYMENKLFIKLFYNYEIHEVNHILKRINIKNFHKLISIAQEFSFFVINFNINIYLCGYEFLCSFEKKDITYINGLIKNFPEDYKGNKVIAISPLELLQIENATLRKYAFELLTNYQVKIHCINYTRVKFEDLLKNSCFEIFYFFFSNNLFAIEKSVNGTLTRHTTYELINFSIEQIHNTSLLIHQIVNVFLQLIKNNMLDFIYFFSILNEIGNTLSMKSSRDLFVISFFKSFFNKLDRNDLGWLLAFTQIQDLKLVKEILMLSNFDYFSLELIEQELYSLKDSYFFSNYIHFPTFFLLIYFIINQKSLNNLDKIPSCDGLISLLISNCNLNYKDEFPILLLQIFKAEFKKCTNNIWRELLILFFKNQEYKSTYTYSILFAILLTIPDHDLVLEILNTYYPIVDFALLETIFFSLKDHLDLIEASNIVAVGNFALNYDLTKNFLLTFDLKPYCEALLSSLPIYSYIDLISKADNFKVIEKYIILLKNTYPIIWSKIVRHNNSHNHFTCNILFQAIRKNHLFSNSNLEYLLHYQIGVYHPLLISKLENSIDQPYLDLLTKQYLFDQHILNDDLPKLEMLIDQVNIYEKTFLLQDSLTKAVYYKSEKIFTFLLLLYKESALNNDDALSLANFLLYAAQIFLVNNSDGALIDYIIKEFFEIEFGLFYLNLSERGKKKLHQFLSFILKSHPNLYLFEKLDDVSCNMQLLQKILKICTAIDSDREIKVQLDEHDMKQNSLQAVYNENEIEVQKSMQSIKGFGINHENLTELHQLIENCKAVKPINNSLKGLTKKSFEEFKILEGRLVFISHLDKKIQELKSNLDYEKSLPETPTDETVSFDNNESALANQLNFNEYNINQKLLLLVKPHETNEFTTCFELLTEFITKTLIPSFEAKIFGYNKMRKVQTKYLQTLTELSNHENFSPEEKCKYLCFSILETLNETRYGTFFTTSRSDSYQMLLEFIQTQPWYAENLDVQKELRLLIKQHEKPRQNHYRTLSNCLALNFSSKI